MHLVKSLNLEIRMSKFEDLLKKIIDKQFRDKYKCLGYFSLQKFLNLISYEDFLKIFVNLEDIEKETVKKELFEKYTFIFSENIDIKKRAEIIIEILTKCEFSEDIINIETNLILCFIYLYYAQITLNRIIRYKFFAIEPGSLIEHILKNFFDNNISFDLEYKIAYNSGKIELHKVQNINDIVELKLNGNVYRGQADVDYDIIPGLFRLHRNATLNEKNIVNEVVKEYPELFIDKKNIDKLCIMQHYHIPTRLLDVTYNPLIALYFACENKEKEQVIGEVIEFDINKFKEVYSDSKISSIIAALAYVEGDYNTDDTIKLMTNKEFWNDIQDAVLQESRNITLKDKKYITDHLFYLLKSKRQTERIKRQDGAFILCGLCDRDIISRELNNRRVQNNGKKFKLIVIKNKKEILKELKVYNIHKHSLFPEIENFVFE